MNVRPLFLRCEYLYNPFGIDVICPRLSWVLQSLDKNARSQKQTAYQILVASHCKKLAADQGNLWDSGKIESAQMNQVNYKGRPLQSRDCSFWKVGNRWVK